MHPRTTFCLGVLVFLVGGMLLWHRRSRTFGTNKIFDGNGRSSTSPQEANNDRTTPSSKAIRILPNGRATTPFGGTNSATSAVLVLQELRGFDDPAAEQLTDVLEQTGWSKEEQLQRFKESYDQLVRIHHLHDLIADNRIEMRSQFEAVETNQLYSPQMRRESRRQNMVLQNTFEDMLHQQQAEIMTNLLGFLGRPPRMESDELRRQLLDVHPRFPIEGPITNSLAQFAPVVSPR